MPPSLPVGVVDAMAVNINIDVDFHALRKSQPPLELEGVPPIDPALLDDIVRYDRVLDPGPLDAAFPGTIGSDAEYKNDSMHELAGGDSPPSAELESPPLPKPTNAKSDELKRLWAEHRERPLVDVMDQLRDHLLNQQAGEVDRSKLLFGMLWVRDNCQRNPQKSVARDVVHAEYKNACMTGRIPDLNAANFGKCVSTVFPNIKVRRLGPRGRSKYNYSEIELIHGSSATSTGSASRPRSSRTPSSTVGLPTLGLSTAEYPSQAPPDLPLQLPPPPPPVRSPTPFNSVEDRPPHVSSRRSSRTIFVDLDAPLDRLTEPDNMMSRPLCIQPEFETPPAQDDISLVPVSPSWAETVGMVDLDRFLSGHRSHCLRLVVLFRKMLMGKFYHAITQYPSRLPPELGLILDQPTISSLVERAERSMYQQMTLFLPRLAFMELGETLEAFRTLSVRLVPTVKAAYADRPPHLQRAMLRAARPFEEILLRFVRLYELVQPVVKIFSCPTSRWQMHRDWVGVLDRRWLVQNVLPASGHVETLRVLEEEVKNLLEPESESEQDARRARCLGTQEILLRWAGLLKTLPQRFPGVSTLDLITHVKMISTAALQEMTIKGCESLTHWSLTKSWFDELVDFFAEVGGFVRGEVDADHHAPPDHHRDGCPVDPRPARVDRTAGQTNGPAVKSAEICYLQGRSLDFDKLEAARTAPQVGSTLVWGRGDRRTKPPPVRSDGTRCSTASKPPSSEIPFGLAERGGPDDSGLCLEDEEGVQGVGDGE